MASISRVESVTLSARRRISPATTEKRLPASPALEASSAALKAMSLVWSATVLMISITRLICLDLAPSATISCRLCWLSLRMSFMRPSTVCMASEPLREPSSVWLAMSTTEREWSAICVEEAESSSMVVVISATDDDICVEVAAWPSTALVISCAAACTRTALALTSATSVRRRACMARVASARVATSSLPATAMVLDKSPRATWFTPEATPSSRPTMWRAIHCASSMPPMMDKIPTTSATLRELSSEAWKPLASMAISITPMGLPEKSLSAEE